MTSSESRSKIRENDKIVHFRLNFDKTATTLNMVQPWETGLDTTSIWRCVMTYQNIAAIGTPSSTNPRIPNQFYMSLEAYADDEETIPLISGSVSPYLEEISDGTPPGELERCGMPIIRAAYMVGTECPMFEAKMPNGFAKFKLGFGNLPDTFTFSCLISGFFERV